MFSAVKNSRQYATVTTCLLSAYCLLLVETRSFLAMMFSMATVMLGKTDVACQQRDVTAVSSTRLQYRVFRKKQPSKTFLNIFTSIKCLCMKFCKFVGNSYLHIQFLQIYLNISSNGINFHEYPSFSPCQVLSIVCLSVR